MSAIFANFTTSVRNIITVSFHTVSPDVIHDMRPIANSVPFTVPMPNNMGVLRYILAFIVLVAHFKGLCGGDFYWPFSGFNAVGGFFAISGFLVYGSYLRKLDLKSYIISRCRRILPAYWATVLLFAIALYFVSTADEYFLSAHFWKYLAANLGFLNFLEPTLPGVFDNCSIPAVNGSLWTMKVEWMLYLSIPLAAPWLLRHKSKILVSLLGIYLFSCLYRIGFLMLYEHYGKEIFQILSRQFLGQLMYFYSGILIYYYFDFFMKWKYPIMLISALLIMAGSEIPFYSVTLEPFLVSALIIGLSFTGKWGTWEGKKDNISYNIYLLHFPVIQLAVQLNLRNHFGTSLTFLIVLIVVLILSVLINFFIEKPLQKRTAPKRLS